MCIYIYDIGMCHMAINDHDIDMFVHLQPSRRDAVAQSGENARLCGRAGAVGGQMWEHVG